MLHQLGSCSFSVLNLAKPSGGGGGRGEKTLTNFVNLECSTHFKRLVSMLHITPLTLVENIFGHGDNLTLQSLQSSDNTEYQKVQLKISIKSHLSTEREVRYRIYK